MLDNDISDSSPKEISSKINDIINICSYRFPGVKLFVLEPLGRCYSNKPDIYWNNATELCKILVKVGGISVIEVPPKLKIADGNLFIRERNGFIHLNHHGVVALENVYCQELINTNMIHTGQSNVSEGCRNENKFGDHQADRLGLLIKNLIEGLKSLK